MAKHLPVLVAGGGIGGLSAAVALARAGFDATVLERNALAEREAVLGLLLELVVQLAELGKFKTVKAEQE